MEAKDENFRMSILISAGGSNMRTGIVLKLRCRILEGKVQRELMRGRGARFLRGTAQWEWGIPLKC